MTPAPNHKPVIAISAANAESKSATAMMVMVRTLGAQPMLISNFGARIGEGAEKGAAEVLAKADGVIVMGNDGDIDPGKYGEAPHPETKIETDLARAAFEEALLKQTIACKKPLLGICGGMQRINVLLGGTLHQDVTHLVGSDYHAQNKKNIPGFVPVQEVVIKHGTQLFGISGGVQNFNENSFHHQALKEVAVGLRVNAVAKDGLAQGIESAPNGPFSDQFIVGVQFHPEFAASDLGPALISNMVAQSSAYAKQHSELRVAGAAEAETRKSSQSAPKAPVLPLDVPPMPMPAVSFADRVLAERAQRDPFFLGI